MSAPFESASLALPDVSPSALFGSSPPVGTPVDASPYELFIDEVDAFCLKTGSRQALNALVLLMRGKTIYHVQLEGSVIRVYPSVAARLVFSEFEKGVS